VGKIKSKPYLVAIFIGIVAALVAWGLSEFSLFKTWEMKTYDLRMVTTHRGSIKPENVVLLYVDEPSLRYMEDQGLSWPWPRELHPLTIDFCINAGAKAIIFDIFFSEDSVYGVSDDDQFTEALGKFPSYFVLFLSNQVQMPDARETMVIEKSAVPLDGSVPEWMPKKQSLLSLPTLPIVEAVKGFGNAQLPPDPDGIYRRSSLLFNLRGEVIPSLALKVASDLKGISNIEWPSEDLLVFGETEIPLDSDGQMMIDYYGKTETIPSYSLAKVMLASTELHEGKTPSVDPAVLKDKIVIIGLAAPGLYDLKPTPFSHVYPGPEIQATMIENLMSGHYIRPLGRTISIVILFVVSIAVALILIQCHRPISIGISLGILSFLLLASSFMLFYYSVWMKMVPPLMAYAFTAFSLLTYRFLTEGRQKREIKRAFGQYLAPDVVRQISEHPELLALGGEERRLTIFFSDIADFTSISEKIRPAELVTELNHYFSVATKIIHEQNGTLDKYIGDAMMAFWGAPVPMDDHAAKGVLAALEIQSVVSRETEFKTRIGLHTSPVIVGNIGSDIRFNYTVIGDAVNLASRLEGLNKYFGTKIMISGETYQESKGRIEARRMGRVRVKGRSEPVEIFEPLGQTGDFGYLKEEGVRSFAEALKAFEGGLFEDAGKKFDKIEKELNDSVSRIYKDMAAQYVKNPPDPFNGVITFDKK